LREVPKAEKFHLLKKLEAKFFKVLTLLFQKWKGYQMINESLSWLRDNELRYGKNPPDNTMDNSQPSL
jgi:hypothetical protein